MARQRKAIKGARLCGSWITWSKIEHGSGWVGRDWSGWRRAPAYSARPERPSAKRRLVFCEPVQCGDLDPCATASYSSQSVSESESVGRSVGQSVSQNQSVGRSVSSSQTLVQERQSAVSSTSGSLLWFTMKLFVATLFLAYLLACAQAYPGSARESSDSEETDDKKNVETVLVLPSGNRPVLGIPSIGDSSEFGDDDDYDDGFNPFSYNPFQSNPFDGFMTRMQDVIRRLREQMTGILSRIPDRGMLDPWGKIPEGANTTSTTKIIDGHIVTINETTFMDENQGTVFRFRVVDVKPQNDTILMTESGIDAEPTTTTPFTAEDTEEKESTTPARSVETVEDFDNEIPKNQGELTA